jgi:hypothetical protein
MHGVHQGKPKGHPGYREKDRQSQQSSRHGANFSMEAGGEAQLPKKKL